jgi:hypothetical protein
MGSVSKNNDCQNNPVLLCHSGFMPKMSRLWMKPMISSRMPLWRPKRPALAREGGRQGSPMRETFDILQ